jgi:agmatine deiminase
MPAETDTHERTWMAWPSKGYTLGATPVEVDTARRTWAAVANAAVEFEPVTMVTSPDHVETARSHLVPRVDVITAPLDDAWMRDIGPSFVVSDDGRLGAVAWVFNGWGQQAWADWDLDAAIATTVAGAAGAEVISSPLVNEGGGIHVDGCGTVLLTETVQLDPLRNASMTKADVERELARTIGAADCVWLPRGLTRDYDDFGTRGHVDIVATIPSPGVLLLHDQRDPNHPDRAVTKELREVLADARDAQGNRFEIVAIPAPATLADAGGPVDWSYLNHYAVNGGVIACTFDDANDDRALSVLADAYPGRQIVGVDARPLFDRGGGIHCITQQEPLV